MAIEIPNEFGLVLAVIAFIPFLNGYCTWWVLWARKQYDVTYPALYAPEGHKHKKEVSF